MPDDRPQDGFLFHLLELRKTLLRCLIALLGGTFLLFPVAGDIYTFLAQPLVNKLPPQSELISIGVIAPFVIQVTTAALSAFLLALPYILFEVWRFVAPGLYAHEKKLVLPLVVSTTLLFFAGMAFAYFLVFNVVFAFIAQVTPDNVVWSPDIQEFFGFAVALFIAFGIAFETPVAVILLVRSGAVELDALKKARPYVIVGAFVVAAIFTPPDVLSQLLLAVPCWILYEIGLFLARPKSGGKLDDAAGEAKSGD